MENLLAGLSFFTDPSVWLLMIVGVLVGMIWGALPGLTDPMALGLAIPFTFGMKPINAIIFLLAVHFGAVYGGAITAILINTPGTPAGAAAALDGYPLTLAGKSRKALQMSAMAEFIGALMSALSLFIFAPLLARVALQFGPAEYFALGIFGLSVVAGISGKSLLKGVIAAALGVFISTIGADPLYGIERFTFGNPYLYDGVNFIATLIGLFAVSEILQFFFRKNSADIAIKNVTGEGLSLHEIKRSLKTMFKGGLIGIIVGALPGTGAPIAAFLSYGEAVRSSKNPEKYGKGELDGIAAAESGAVGTESSALIPMLTFGIPGDAGSAILMSAFILHGIQIGPSLFQKSGSLVAAMFISILIMVGMVFLFSWYGSSVIAKVIKIPPHFLYPAIIGLIVAGAFGLANDLFNVWVTLVFGLIGLIMLNTGYSIPAMLLGIIVGPIIERNFLTALSAAGGNIIEVLTRPLTAGILCLALITMFLSLKVHRKIAMSSAADAN